MTRAEPESAFPAESPQAPRAEAHDLYRRFVNPDFVDLLEALDFGRLFVRAEGTKLYDDVGEEYTDFLAGFGVHNIGHNHPRLMRALHAALDTHRPSMLNIDAPLAQARLAEQLTAATHAELCRIVFANSGAEAVEMAVKTTRAATGRKALVACQGAYHGLSTGALSLMDDPRRCRPFGPLLQHVHHIPFDDLDALRAVCRQEKPAGFFVEPIQAEGGIRIPADDYLKHSARICRDHGCLLIVDEIQTGLGRTGRLFATPLAEVVPDMLLLGKALSGGVVPVAAAMMTREVWHRAYAGPVRCNLSASTFAGGHLAMTAALETLAIVQADALAQQAAAQGEYLLRRLRPLTDRHAVIREIRGRGLLFGIEFQPAAGLLIKAVPRWAREGLYAQVISVLLLRAHHIVTQPCSLRENVLRIEPPLTIACEEIDRLAEALDRALVRCPTHLAAAKLALRKRLLRKDL